MNVDEDRKIESDFVNCFRILGVSMFSVCVVASSFTLYSNQRLIIMVYSINDALT